MKITHITVIIYLLSVVIPIQSGETIYVYNYDNLTDIFPQKDRINDFHLYKYSDIDKIFDDKYKGSNIGGAFLLEGNYAADRSEAHVFPGYIVNITLTFYCGSTEEGFFEGLVIEAAYDDAEYGMSYICDDRTGWHNDTWIQDRWSWIPTTIGTGGFTVEFRARNATPNRPYGIDELRLTTSDTPPQLLQSDNSTSSNDPRKKISSDDP